MFRKLFLTHTHKNNNNQQSVPDWSSTTGVGRFIKNITKKSVLQVREPWMWGKRWSKGGKMRNLPSIVAPEAKIRWINELLVLRHVTAIIIKNVQRQQRQFNFKHALEGKFTEALWKRSVSLQSWESELLSRASTCVYLRLQANMAADKRLKTKQNTSLSLQFSHLQLRLLLVSAWHPRPVEQINPKLFR